MKYHTGFFIQSLLYRAADIVWKTDFFPTPLIGGTLGVRHTCIYECNLVIIPPHSGMVFLDFETQNRTKVTKEENK